MFVLCCDYLVTIGLSSPAAGVETLVKASGEKIGSLCFQLQMTGYLFRNAEYVLALRDLLKLKGKASIRDYKRAFGRLDTDGSGYIEISEIQKLFDDVYGGKAPPVEIKAFLQFFDQNNDGKISWEEFETGLGAAVATQRDKGEAAAALLGVDLDDDENDDDDDDDEEEVIDINTDVSGTFVKYHVLCNAAALYTPSLTIGVRVYVCMNRHN